MTTLVAALFIAFMLGACVMALFVILIEVLA